MRRTLVTLALTLPLLTPSAPRLDPLWAFLSSLWTGSLTKEGCGADPSGRCNPGQPQQPQSEAGCGADPDGRCNPGS
jgi:hypothetical protein